MNKVSVIVPALDEEESIGALISDLAQQSVSEIVVVDNGSTDDTAGVAGRAGARVIHEPRRGYGRACAAGLAAAPDADVLIFIDGDYSFSPSEIPILLQAIDESQIDLVLGSRVLGTIAPGSMPFQQRFGNWLTARLLRSLYGLDVTDLGPFRAVRRDMLAALDMREMTYGWPTEMIIKAHQQAARIVEVPVSYRSRLGGHSKVSGTLQGTVKAAYRILSVTFRYVR